MLDLILHTIFVSLLVSCIIILVDKLEVINYLMSRSNKFFNRLLNCNFCLGFWLSVIITIVIMIRIGEVYCIIIPFLSSPLIRVLT